MTHGGSEILEGPDDYGDIAKGLFHELGIQPRRLGDAYDLDFYKKNGLTAGLYFDRETFGRIAIANSDAGSISLINVAIDQAHRAVSELV